MAERLQEAAGAAATLRTDLLALDRIGVIELLPGDRIRPKVARDVDWLPAGPIRRFFFSAMRAGPTG